MCLYVNIYVLDIYYILYLFTYLLTYFSDILFLIFIYSRIIVRKIMDIVVPGKRRRGGLEGDGTTTTKKI